MTPRGLCEAKAKLLYIIEDFTIEDLNKLAEEARKNEIEIVIRAEDSNMYKGTLLELQTLSSKNE